MRATYKADVEAILSAPTATVDQAAQVLGIGRNQAYVAVRTGQIPSLTIGRRILVPTAKLLAMLEGEPVDAA